MRRTSQKKKKEDRAISAALPWQERESSCPACDASSDFATAAEASGVSHPSAASFHE